jgi:uncharacterized protein YbjT (DUF2867 family)
MNLVTGSAGKTGRAVLQALLAKGEAVRALVHRPEYIHVMKSLGVQDAMVGDMMDRGDLERACKQVRVVYHICPNVSPDEESIGQTVIGAAQSRGVEHFVYHSVLHPQTEAMPHHWKKLRVEEQLVQSGLTFTILQPTVYMQNILAHWATICEHGVYRIPYPAETRLSFVDLMDVARAAAIVITEPGYHNAIYELVGTHGITQIEIGSLLTRSINRSIQIEVIPIPEWEQQARDKGLGEYQIEALTQMFRFYAQNGMSGSPRVLGWLLGKSPTTLEDFVQMISQLPPQKTGVGS